MLCAMLPACVRNIPLATQLGLFYPPKRKQGEDHSNGNPDSNCHRHLIQKPITTKLNGLELVRVEHRSESLPNPFHGKHTRKVL
jgi:hypothetical protein